MNRIKMIYLYKLVKWLISELTNHLTNLYSISTDLSIHFINLILLKHFIDLLCYR